MKDKSHEVDIAAALRKDLQQHKAAPKTSLVRDPATGNVMERSKWEKLEVERANIRLEAPSDTLAKRIKITNALLKMSGAPDWVKAVPKKVEPVASTPALEWKDRPDKEGYWVYKDTKGDYLAVEHYSQKEIDEQTPSDRYLYLGPLPEPPKEEEKPTAEEWEGMAEANEQQARDSEGNVLKVGDMVQCGVHACEVTGIGFPVNVKAACVDLRNLDGSACFQLAEQCTKLTSDDGFDVESGEVYRGEFEGEHESIRAVETIDGVMIKRVGAP